MNRKSVWKYCLENVETQSLMIPEGAEILTVQTQGGTPCLWALVSVDAPKQRRVIEILNTGDPAAVRNRNYIGTVQQPGRLLVWHVFEIP